MNAEQLRAARDQIVATFGPWTAHNIDLGNGVRTIDGLPDGAPGESWRVRWMRKLMQDFGKKPLTSSRILDLACLEGLFAIEFAREGANTVGLEIRDIHIAKAEFARRMLGLENCRIVQGDVRAIPADLGRFDIVICAGILYHLDFPDCIRFLRAIAGRSDDLVIIDSHFAYDDINESVLPLTEMRQYKFEGRTYRGRAIVEHERHVTNEQKAKKHLWASIDNDISVWLDERDVVATMEKEGFHLAMREYPGPGYRANHPDRPTLVFKRGA